MRVCVSARQIAIVLDHLNQRNLVHRDLKLNNVVVMGEGVDEGEIRCVRSWLTTYLVQF